MSDSDAGTIECSRTGGVLEIVLDRPARKNALSAEMVESLVRTLEEAAVDDELRVVLLTGAGADFCSGVDWVATNERSSRPRTGHLVRRTPLRAHRIVQLLYELQLPVVCVVRGWAAGLGLGLALAADFTVVADSARLWAPFRQRGFTPDSGTTWFLPRLVGMARAKELLLLGRPVTGSDAAQMGLVHRAVADDALETAGADLVAELAAGPTIALGLAKASLHAAVHRPLTEALVDETLALELASRTADFREGLTAFRERRDPRFTGR